MGQFYKLKYFAGDLKQEIHYPIQEAREGVWKQNLSLTRPGLMAKEVDDFTTRSAWASFRTLPAYPAIRAARGTAFWPHSIATKNHSGLQRRERSSTGVSPADERLFPAAINAQF